MMKVPTHWKLEDPAYASAYKLDSSRMLAAKANMTLKTWTEQPIQGLNKDSTIYMGKTADNSFKTRNSMAQ